MKVCKRCASVDLVKRGNGFRNLCYKCYLEYTKECYHKNKELYLETRKRIYKRNSEKRKKESSLYKSKNREKYNLLEWFRKNKISITDINKNKINMLVEMSKELKKSKEILKLINYK